jgi:predicted RNA-binding protein YlxR (DUF448 family)
MKKIPLRRCVATMVQLPKKELIRIVKTPQGVVQIDLTGKANGRGAYLARNLDALAIAIKKGALARALECDIPDSLYDELREMMSER